MVVHGSGVHELDLGFFWIQTPAASNRFRSEVFFYVAGLKWI